MKIPAIAGFDWDQGNWPKCGKHGLNKAEIESVFKNRPAVYPDPAHSLQEERLLAIGSGKGKRWVLVAFTLRGREGDLFIRPLSARYMHEKEVKHYEEQKKS